MPERFEQSLKSLQKRLNKELMVRGKNTRNQVMGPIAKLFQNNARERVNDATPKDATSEYLLNRVKKSIILFEDKQNCKYTVEVLPVENGLPAYLEYGTGWAGAFDQHEEASKDNWDYAINRESYITRAGRTGWFFSSEDSYVDKDDEHPVRIVQKRTKRKEFVKAHTRKLKNGTEVSVRRYMRKRPHGDKEITSVREYDKWVFSDGLRPVRFLYRTKEEIKNKLADWKGIDFGVDVVLEDIKNMTLGGGK